MTVKEITLDMASSMKLIAKRCFSCATQVIDRFHVQKLAIEALQKIRIRHRWDAFEMKNKVVEGPGEKQIPSTRTNKTGWNFSQPENDNNSAINLKSNKNSYRNDIFKYLCKDKDIICTTT
ncbi:transposase [Chryseobacterium sp. CBSDS_008]|uniref:transposase n=1 Tax=Chryseobacterium sp. CBSDS_008 TaxID=3415265 RepID=UPI003CF5A98D